MINNYLRNIFYCVFIIIFGVYLSGCTALLIGGAVGALGGYAISRDTIAGETDKDSDSLWMSAKDVLAMMGAHDIEDSAVGIIRARIEKTRVTITVEQLTLATSRVKVKCRRYIFPNLGLSEKLYIRIIENTE